jgi:glycine cleavage system H protein
MISLPETLEYTAEHEWVARDGETVTGGISHIAADALGDLVYVQAPDVGSTVTGGEICGELESTKTVSDLYSPLTGEVVEVNEVLGSGPETVNADPYGAGWLFRLRTTDDRTLLTAAEYAAVAAD